MTERGQQILKHIVRRGRQLSAESITADLQTSSGLQISSRAVRRELHGIGFHGAMQSVGSLNRTSPSGNLMDESGLAVARRTVLV